MQQWHEVLPYSNNPKHLKNPKDPTVAPNIFKTAPKTTAIHRFNCGKHLATKTAPTQHTNQKSQPWHQTYLMGSTNRYRFFVDKYNRWKQMQPPKLQTLAWFQVCCVCMFVLFTVCCSVTVDVAHHQSKMRANFRCNFVMKTFEN